MKCREARERITEGFDAGSSDTSELRKHLVSCAECQREWQRDHAVWKKLRPAERIVASHQFVEQTMTAIRIEAAKERTERQTLKRGWPRWAWIAVAAGLLVLLIPLLPFGKSNKAGVELLAQSVKAMEQLRTVHIVGQMRTVQGDNFELIGTNYEFVPLEIWRDYGTPTRWRIEKPGRVVVMDGQQSVLYLSQNNEAAKGTPQTGFVEWLRPLLNPETVLENELAAARKGDAKVAVTEHDGVLKVYIARNAQGDFKNDWLKNKSIDAADHTRVYQFDAKTKLLTSLTVVVHTGDRNTNVLQLSSFKYNEPLPNDLFTLTLPAGVNWFVPPSAMSVAPSFSGPREVAEFFFDGLAREDWEGVKQVLPVTNLSDTAKDAYGGLTVQQIGQPFQSGLYRGWFVPYEIRLSNGEVKRHKLAVRNDNPQQRWFVDGGW